MRLGDIWQSGMVIQRVGAWIDFHNYGRSEKDASPPAGQWDYKGSRIWLNGKVINYAFVRPTGTNYDVASELLFCTDRRLSPRSD
ncbi:MULTISPECIES: hypothetical protein [unclassified Spirosoma]|uniref:hypothetical protein n=1 Tax=unclassified Spirosoma TaxID=2621999 RepID=UPI0025F30501|nr:MULTISPECIES: hypothetical protein [unclassified Spirosoma]